MPKRPNFSEALKRADSNLQRCVNLPYVSNFKGRAKERILRRMPSPCFTYSNENKQRRLVDDV